MSGHSKWANIKHKKAKTDAIKGRIFTKLAREIMVAARAGGADPNGNFRLKIAIDNAKAANLPNDNIQRAIQKGAGAGEGANYEELRYEGYGPGGVAIMVELMTDNRNRTASEMRHLFSKNGGNLGETGSVSWMFTEKGQLDVPKEDLKMDEDEIMLLALEAGAEDVASEDESYEIFTEPDSMQEVRQVLLDSKIPIENVAINLIPVNRVEIADIEQAKKIIKLIDSLESHDDVQKVYTNFDLAESLEDADL
ncbi:MULTISPECIES: YebC/PmpR family DNA-binding transcriptional regulator [Dehalobacter]|uniref:Probable transcriptional regulatory protein GQ588_09005 n=2 Tax=Dehalobacter restrictus TaxID=55583 RepID=A0A857DJT9_9FIRM|nr:MULTISPECIES: YebC/PmpR family DNA-binding transcriptional regulator [Dehalobacter]AHF10160.1 transcriptional regulator [Dehalobacter restrictus DSM 9455]MCG1025049.1 YebC/PmpR family DNA-binding transcriptional regulator [Dehalobacter sp.]MDJ0305741.1 YebC/PmpR family DNA-binding transcriptional regulator [Dehalobacter sp.]OCZ52613.1 transcriptional regulator [Dehalobacter sp. TeCB1]QHA00762.1 YebC/PmpR family DNA-binding transcriptional regulator [Dehalobacter restrictus]